jgi:hypothetical protein
MAPTSPPTSPTIPTSAPRRAGSSRCGAVPGRSRHCHRRPHTQADDGPRRDRSRFLAPATRPISLRPRRRWNRSCRCRAARAHHPTRAHRPTGTCRCAGTDWAARPQLPGALPRAHHPVRTHRTRRVHRSGAHLPAPVATMVSAAAGPGGPAQEEPGEEDHRDDEQDTGDDAHPRQDLVQPTGSVVVRRRCGRVSHGFDDADGQAAPCRALSPVKFRK